VPINWPAPTLHWRPPGEYLPARPAYRGRAPALNAQQVAQLRQRVADGTPKARLAREFGVSRETVYQYLRASPGAERTS